MSSLILLVCFYYYYYFKLLLDYGYNSKKINFWFANHFKCVCVCVCLCVYVCDVIKIISAREREREWDRTDWNSSHTHTHTHTVHTQTHTNARARTHTYTHSLLVLFMVNAEPQIRTLKLSSCIAWIYPKTEVLCSVKNNSPFRVKGRNSTWRGNLYLCQRLAEFNVFLVLNVALQFIVWTHTYSGYTSSLRGWKYILRCLRVRVSSMYLK
jgi:hypothetical protein